MRLDVASRVEAWIETVTELPDDRRETVASRVEAWIETALTSLTRRIDARRLPRGGVD
jgi:hypothetical protein